MYLLYAVCVRKIMLFGLRTRLPLKRLQRPPLKRVIVVVWIPASGWLISIGLCTLIVLEDGKLVKQNIIFTINYSGNSGDGLGKKMSKRLFFFFFTLNI